MLNLFEIKINALLKMCLKFVSEEEENRDSDLDFSNLLLTRDSLVASY